MQIVNVSDSGATFMAEIYSLGIETILDHGFVWGVDKALDIRYSDRIHLGEINEEGVFDSQIRTALKTGRNYFVQAFVKTDKRIVYSAAKQFMSLGSLGATITGFIPKTGGIRDTIVIRGKNFSWNRQQNTVRIGLTKCYPFESSDTLIKFEVPAGIKDIKNIISVDVASSVSYFTRDTFKFIPPSVTDYFPKTGFWGDTLTITGNYLDAIDFSTTNYFKIHNYSCNGILRSRNILKVRVSDELDVQSGLITLEIAGFHLSIPEPFLLKEPYFTFSPSSGTWADRVTLKGRFSGNPRRNIVFFGLKSATVISVTNSELVVSVPANLDSPECSVSLNTRPYEIISPVHFNLLPPEIISFSPVSGSTGSVITIHGKHLGNPGQYIYPEVRFGELGATLISCNDSTIRALVPNNVGGHVKIYVMVAAMTAESEDLFSVENPYITFFHPQTGTFNDEITIEGANFVDGEKVTQVSFNGSVSEIVSLTPQRIVVKVPLSTDSIPQNIIINSGANICVSENKFTLLPPSINSFSPSSITPGSDIVITGTNFNPIAENNNISWCGFPLAVKSSTANMITATWPESVVRSEGPIKINIGGYSRATSQNIVFTNSKWRKIRSPEILSYLASENLYGKALNGYGYVINQAHQVYRFNPATYEWAEISSVNPVMSLIYSSAEIVAGDSLYLLSGRSYDPSVIRRYSPSSNSWKLIPEEPHNQVGIAFYLGNNIFFGLDNYSLSGWFYRCDILDNYKWSRIGDFPEQLPSSFNTYFTAGDKGFVLFTNGALWEFDSGSLSWARKKDFPGESREKSFSFELNGKHYIGGGAYGFEVYDDIWEYDSGSDTWSLYAIMPFRRFGSVAFSVNGKLYFGYGYNFDPSRYLSESMDFYEYDPEYPVY